MKQDTGIARGKRDRDAQGRFLPGHAPTPGGGRPPRATEAAYLQAFREEVPIEKWRELLRMAVADALGDNWKARDAARRWLAEYCIPRTRIATLITEEDLAGGKRLSLLEALEVLGASLVEPKEVEISPEG